MVFGVELGLANPKVVGAAALWCWFPKVAGFVELTTIDGIPSPILLPSGRTEPYSSVQELDDVPYIGLSAFFRRDQVVTAKIAFPDDRAERMLRDQSAQLPKGKRGVIMIARPSSESELKVWRPLILRRFQPGIHTRIGGVCLFEGDLEAKPAERFRRT